MTDEHAKNTVAAALPDATQNTIPVTKAIVPRRKNAPEFFRDSLTSTPFLAVLNHLAGS
ncbi:hypothetical protein OIE62_15600 [Streptomyces scopuliridis]|uniref:Uncharacterized protein n=1 Tax=Streptomyces scopuliridis TaxID=452529 RepID=A0ACD4ZPN4_9ACTN|nr:hypothetical protein [Streptomyces scopuliridis]WSB35765.1 hypothetical protein OG949_24925 [Streptomyces scopuliridis]WSB99986.1 hypothetical protein OG835_25355 [Streptomyces scopuliridis]WSC06315.1 hypothetical protein OIE62_15600 [Streptomyces scopuliridis]